MAESYSGSISITLITGKGLPDIYAVTDVQDWLAYAVGVRRDGTVRYADVPLNSFFSPRTAGPGVNVKMADLDGDGDLDVAVSAINNRFFDPDPVCANVGRFALLRNTSGFLFDPFHSHDKNIHVKPFDFAFADFNSDGRTDIFMGLCEGGYKVFLQN